MLRFTQTAKQVIYTLNSLAILSYFIIVILYTTGEVTEKYYDVIPISFRIHQFLLLMIDSIGIIAIGSMLLKQIRTYAYEQPLILVICVYVTIVGFGIILVLYVMILVLPALFVDYME